MMKADVMNDFENIKVCDKYKSEGIIRDDFPFDLSEDTLAPVYQEMKGWNESLNNVTSFDELPDPLSEYIRFIEKETGIPVDMVSIGPDRVQILKR
jgi:adenylosuccinate synthase